jgi:hypothetical protein
MCSSTGRSRKSWPPSIYEDRPKGHPPVPPALLALVPLLQAYTGASDAEAVEAG